MRLVRISWREAIKRFTFLRCCGCYVDDHARPDNAGVWYIEEQTRSGPFCPTCAEKLATGADSTRSATQFYSDTRGTNVVIHS